MKAVMPEVPQHFLESRARIGADRWDEMWEGELHMPPAPNRSHQDLILSLARWIWTYWAQPLGNRVHQQINVASVGGWPHNYRVPDLVLLTPDRFSIDHNEYFEGPPAVVVEIHSPGDEAYEKLPFYAKLGVPEVWIIDRDSRAPEILVLKAGNYAAQTPGADGWIKSEITGVLLRGEPGGKLAIQVSADPNTQRLLPED